MNKIGKITGVTILLAAMILASACNSRTLESEDLRQTNLTISDEHATEESFTTAESEPSASILPDVLSMDLVLHPSVDPTQDEHPAESLHRSLNDAYAPNEEQLRMYEDAFRAVVAKEPELDITTYDLTFKEKVVACELLYGESTFRLPYLQFIRFAPDESAVYFIYKEQPEEQILQDREIIAARFGQLIYNVAPEDAADVVRYAAIYQYLCETCDYSPDMSDEFQMGPDSLLLNHTGICWGYSTLVNLVLPYIGIDGIYVSNDAHAWNQVLLNGKYFHTDVTFGAGNYGDPDTYFNTFLMDDTAREQTLRNASVDVTGAKIGLYSETPTPPYVCDNNSADPLMTIYGNYAADIPGGCLYFFDYEGIWRIGFDGTDKEKVSDAYVFDLVCWNGTLYYLSAENFCLFSLLPGGEPEKLSEEKYVALALHESTLVLTCDDADSTATRIPLQPDASALETAGSVSEQPGVTVSLSDTFHFVITFASPVAPSADVTQLVVLTDDVGQALACRYEWNADRTTLTVRPSYSVDPYTYLRFYVVTGAPVASTAEGIDDKDGLEANSSEDRPSVQVMPVNLVSAVTASSATA